MYAQEVQLVLSYERQTTPGRVYSRNLDINIIGQSAYNCYFSPSNSRTSTHWRLTDGRVSASDSSLFAGAAPGGEEPDPLLHILTNKVVSDGKWKLEADKTCQDCDKADDKHKGKKSEEKEKASETKSSAQSTNCSKTKKEVLDCGKPINTTQFDHLRGIANRHEHPHIPEPEVAMIFRKKGGRHSEVDMNELERRLKKSKKDRPKSAQVYNQIGNFWRIRGNTQLSIECFRKALSISPNNPDVLLNLARVLFNLQFLDDAIFLTRRSLEMQSPDQNPWLQHFTLGEILKAYGHYQEATHHFRHTLELKPGFQPAQANLREMEVSPDGTVTYYTLFIILFLVMGVLCGILTSVEANFEEYGEMMKTQRHFNRAMAMRSIKLGMNPRIMRMKKYHC